MKHDCDDGGEQRIGATETDDCELRKAITEAGLTCVEMYNLCLLEEVAQVSEHITIPASALGLSVHELPIVKLVMARK